MSQGFVAKTIIVTNCNVVGAGRDGNPGPSIMETRSVSKTLCTLMDNIQLIDCLDSCLALRMDSIRYCFEKKSRGYNMHIPQKRGVYHVRPFDKGRG
jgi:hypothetical protein